MKKFIKTFFITILIIIIVLVLFSSCGSSKKTETSSKNTETIDINSMPYIDAVRYIAEKELKNKGENLQITTSIYGDGDINDAKNVMVEFLLDSYWDSTDFVRKAFSHYVNICKEAYTHKDAIDIYFNVDGVLIDNRGQKEVRTQVYLIMPIKNFNLYNWDNLKFQKLDFDLISKDCKIFMIKRPLINDFDASNFFYEG